MFFVLVRHAHAGDKSRWKHADEDRPVSGTGRQQSEGLVESLGGIGLRTLVSSPYLRCRQTMEPLAAATGLTVMGRTALAPDADPAELDAMLAEPDVDGAALCTHGETLTALMKRWQDTGQLGAAERPEGTAKGAAWVVHSTEARRTLLYVPPLLVARSARRLGRSSFEPRATQNG